MIPSLEPPSLPRSISLPPSLSLSLPHQLHEIFVFFFVSTSPSLRLYSDLFFPSCVCDPNFFSLSLSLQITCPSFFEAISNVAHSTREDEYMYKVGEGRGCYCLGLMTTCF